VHVFVSRRSELLPRRSRLEEAILSAGDALGLLAQKAAKVATDLTEDVLREVALQSGLVDVKVCAVDAVWSGLKLVGAPEGPPRARAPVEEEDASHRAGGEGAGCATCTERAPTSSGAWPA
jgi:hypothetical protein